MSDTIGVEKTETPDKEQPQQFFISQESRKDGRADITVSPRGVKATATFYPPAIDGVPLRYNTVITRLDETGIVYGVKNEAISEALLQCSNEHVTVHNVVIAECDMPVAEIPLHYTIRSELQISMLQLASNSNRRIEWKALTSFVIVKKDELIAHVHLRVAGKTGKNIYGKDLSFETVSTRVYTAGKNVVINNEGIFAAQDGRLILQENGTIIVEDTLILKNGINNTTGSIAFPRDIVCSGTIEDGFKVFSGGSFMSSEVIDATEIVCKKDLITKSGIIGRLNGTVKVSGNLTAQFIQSCRVAVKENCMVANSIIKSTVYSLKRIQMSDQGKIVGGECWSVLGISTSIVGNAAEIPTLIVCGVNFIVKQERDRLNNQLLQLTMLMNQLKTNAESPPVQHRIQELTHIKENLVQKIAQTMAKDLYMPDAVVEVSDTVYPGTTVTICEASFFVTKKMEKVRFKLDQQKNSIFIEDIKKSQ